MTTGDHSVWSAHRDGESLREVADDRRMTPMTTMDKDPDSGGAQIVFGGKTHGTAENTDGINVAIRVQACTRNDQ